MILERIRSGDRDAYTAFHEEMRGPLSCYLLAFSESRDNAEDIAQEAFVRLWEHRSSWTTGSAKALVLRIARNLAFDQRRRVAVRNRWRSWVPCPSTTTPEEELVELEVGSRLLEAVESLPLRRREVFELVRFRGLSYEEVGGALQISRQTVANHMSMALRDLRIVLADLLDDVHPLSVG